MGSASVTKAPPSSSSSPNSSSTESLDGLKFGQKIYFEDVSVAATTTTQGAYKTSRVVSSPSSASKKGRGGSLQPPRCQVEGCKVDLSGAKAYYSRHKVCTMHSKFPTVIVAGLEQRFCQQCSRSPSSLSLSLYLLFIYYWLQKGKKSSFVFVTLLFLLFLAGLLYWVILLLLWFPFLILLPLFLLFLVHLLYCYAIHMLLFFRRKMVLFFIPIFTSLCCVVFGCIFYICCFSFQEFNHADFVPCDCSL